MQFDGGISIERPVNAAHVWNVPSLLRLANCGNRFLAYIERIQLSHLFTHWMYKSERSRGFNSLLLAKLISTRMAPYQFFSWQIVTLL
jgi:hypothetical protein